MSQRNFNRLPKTTIPWAATVAATGIAAYTAAKRKYERRAEIAEKAEAQILYQATHDNLTGVLNRRGLDQVLATNTSSRAMLVADSTKLKAVNDKFGHSRGDEAIIATAEVLKRSLRPGDILARTGGDEFQVLLDPRPPVNRYPVERDRRGDRSYLDPSILLTPVIARVAQETQSLLELPENADMKRVGFDIAVGGAVWEKGMSADDVRTVADAAMYSVKEAQHTAANDGSSL